DEPLLPEKGLANPAGRVSDPPPAWCCPHGGRQEPGDDGEGSVGQSSGRVSPIRCHTSQRWTGTLASTSKPSFTFPPRMSSTVTLSRCLKPSTPPTTTASSRFLDKTNMVEPPFS